MKHGSEHLYNLAEERSGELSRMFKNLTRQMKDCLYKDCSGYQLDAIYRYEGIIKDIQHIIEVETGVLTEETHEEVIS